MKTGIWLVGFAAMVVPVAAGADIGARLGLEMPLYTHVSSNGQSASFSIGDSFQPAINALVEYYPFSLIGIGAEFREGLFATGAYSRTGTSLGPNLTVDLFPLPIYARAAFPLHLEPTPVRLDFRAAGGLKLGLPLLALYLEAVADFYLVGSGYSAFTSQSIGLGAGVWLKF